MKERETEKIKSPVTAPVAKGGKRDLKIKRKPDRGPGTVKHERRSAGAAEIIKMVRYAAVEGRDIKWGGERV